MQGRSKTSARATACRSKIHVFQEESEILVALRSGGLRGRARCGQHRAGGVERSANHHCYQMSSEYVSISILHAEHASAGNRHDYKISSQLEGTGVRQWGGTGAGRGRLTSPRSCESERQPGPPCGIRDRRKQLLGSTLWCSSRHKIGGHVWPRGSGLRRRVLLLRCRRRSGKAAQTRVAGHGGSFTTNTWSPLGLRRKGKPWVRARV